MALMGKLFPTIGDTSCKNFENIFNSVSNISMILFQKPYLKYK